MDKIMHLLDVVDGVRDHVALGLMSDPGLSKTSQVKQWAEQNDRRYCELIISQRMPSEISGMPMPVADSHRMEVFDFETLRELKEGDVLAFDEFTNGNIQTLNACLTLIQERVMLSGHKLPSLVVVAMGNPQGRCDLLPQTKQRFWWVDVAWHAQTWIDYMKKVWNITPHSRLVNAITDQYRAGFGDAAKYNYLTPRTVENLLRIAMTIPIEDTFWRSCELDTSLVSALYSSMQNKDTFREVQNQLIDWVADQSRVTSSTWMDLILRALTEAKSLGDLRLLVESLEQEGTAPEFVEFIKANASYRTSLE